jgi:hypothetical protein
MDLELELQDWATAQDSVPAPELVLVTVALVRVLVLVQALQERVEVLAKVLVCGKSATQLRTQY